jgi:hypothetical protein
VHEYLDEKAEALQKLANHFRDLTEPPPANVVEMGKEERLANA